MTRDDESAEIMGGYLAGRLDFVSLNADQFNAVIFGTIDDEPVMLGISNRDLASLAATANAILAAGDDADEEAHEVTEVGGNG